MEMDIPIVSLGAKFAEILAEKGCYKISGTSCTGSAGHFKNK